MLIYKIRYIENNFPVEKIFEFFNRIGRRLPPTRVLRVSPLEETDTETRFLRGG